MRDYKIENSDLGYKICRIDGDIKEYYDVKGDWNKNKTRAKLFFHREDAASALVVLRMRKGKKKPEPEPKVEKQSWSELS